MCGIWTLWVLFTFQRLLDDRQSDKKEESCKTPTLCGTQQDPPETQEVEFRLLHSHSQLRVILHLLDSSKPLTLRLGEGTSDKAVQPLRKCFFHLLAQTLRGNDPAGPLRHTNQGRNLFD